jgi:hypothetical protein
MDKDKAHFGDPCEKCGLPHDDVAPGPCLGSARSDQWDAAIRGPKMSGNTGNRIWKYQMPVSENFTMKLPRGAEIIRMAGENGMLWLWAIVDTSAPDEVRSFDAFKAGGTMPDDLSRHIFRGMAHIYIQAELMLYIFEVIADEN